MEDIILKLNDGFTMMLIGMGTVLIFLCLMIVAMTIMSKVVARLNELFPEAVPVAAGSGKKAIAKSDDSEIAAAIVAAMFRK
jgi:oxaloacetate decarboxylase gamma subunit